MDSEYFKSINDYLEKQMSEDETDITNTWLTLESVLDSYGNILDPDNTKSIADRFVETMHCVQSLCNVCSRYQAIINNMKNEREVLLVLNGEYKRIVDGIHKRMTEMDPK